MQIFRQDGIWRAPFELIVIIKHLTQVPPLFKECGLLVPQHQVQESLRGGLQWDPWLPSFPMQKVQRSFEDLAQGQVGLDAELVVLEVRAGDPQRRRAEHPHLLPLWQDALWAAYQAWAHQHHPDHSGLGFLGELDHRGRLPGRLIHPANHEHKQTNSRHTATSSLPPGFSVFVDNCVLAHSSSLSSWRLFLKIWLRFWSIRRQLFRPTGFEGAGSTRSRLRCRLQRSASLLWYSNAGWGLNKN